MKIVEYVMSSLGIFLQTWINFYHAFEFLRRTLRFDKRKYAICKCSFLFQFQRAILGTYKTVVINERYSGIFCLRILHFRRMQFDFIGRQTWTRGGTLSKCYTKSQNVGNSDSGKLRNVCSSFRNFSRFQTRSSYRNAESCNESFFSSLAFFTWNHFLQFHTHTHVP